MHEIQRLHIMVRSRTMRRNAAHAHLWRWPARRPRATTRRNRQRRRQQRVMSGPHGDRERHAIRRCGARGIILLITDQICTSERNLQRQIRGTLSRVPLKRSRAEMCKRKKRASASRRAGRFPPNYLFISRTKFEDCALDATHFFR